MDCKLDEFELNLLENSVVPQLQTCIEIGWSIHVEGLLNVQTRKAYASGREDIIAIFQEAERWLSETKALEAIHGKGCRMNVNHPVYVRAKEALERRPIRS